jgi:SAM-dependent methyltransferase
MSWTSAAAAGIWPPYAVPPPVGAVPLSSASHLRGCLRESAKEAARAAAGLGRRGAGGRDGGCRRRTPEASIAEYERRWRAQASKRPWLHAEDVDSAVGMSSYGQQRLHAMVDFTPCRVPAPAFFRWRARKIAAIFLAHHPRSTAIAEIGCGIGKNLLALAQTGYQDLAGYDPTEAAARAVQAQAAHFGLPIRSGRFDLVNPSPAVLSRLQGRVLFTNHVLEQLPQHIPAALGCLLRAAPHEVVHIEPCPERLRPWRSAVDLATWLHTAASDYQRTLLRELAELELSGRITILELTPLGYAPRPRSLPTLVRWRPRP